MHRLLLITSLVFSSLSFAEPRCLADRKGLAGTPESVAAAILKDNKIDENEVFARLVFAETSASGCASTTESDAVALGIAWVLRNRALEPKRFGHGTRVVTAPKQFRSTLGTYDVARRDIFLCPGHGGADWRARWEKAVAAWAATADAAKNPVPAVFNYYLPRHFEGSKLKDKVARPDWASPPNERVTMPGLSTTSECLELWRKPEKGV